jgi:SAM-dependent methyltransferase
MSYSPGANRTAIVIRVSTNCDSAPTRRSANASCCEWANYLAHDYVFANFPPGSRVLDVGFGGGGQMRRVRRTGGVPFGIEYDSSLTTDAHAAGLQVCRAKAEWLPFASGSFDGVICKVVVPYTDEARAVAEIARVLRPGGTARVSYHGLGYNLRYLLAGSGWKHRVYAARTIANTFVYRATGRRLPGFWGDTLYESAPSLRRYYRRSRLEILEAQPSPGFAGAPVFIYHTLRRVA